MKKSDIKDNYDLKGIFRIINENAAICDGSGDHVPLQEKYHNWNFKFDVVQKTY